MPLPATPPIQLIQIQNEFSRPPGTGRNSLVSAAVYAGTQLSPQRTNPLGNDTLSPSKVGMLEFLGKSAVPQRTLYTFSTSNVISYVTIPNNATIMDVAVVSGGGGAGGAYSSSVGSGGVTADYMAASAGAGSGAVAIWANIDVTSFRGQTMEIYVAAGGSGVFSNSVPSSIPFGGTGGTSYVIIPNVIYFGRCLGGDGSLGSVSSPSQGFPGPADGTGADSGFVTNIGYWPDYFSSYYEPGMLARPPLLPNAGGISYSDGTGENFLAGGGGGSGGLGQNAAGIPRAAEGGQGTKFNIQRFSTSTFATGGMGGFVYTNFPGSYVLSTATIIARNFGEGGSGAAAITRAGDGLTFNRRGNNGAGGFVQILV